MFAKDYVVKVWRIESMALIDLAMKQEIWSFSKGLLFFMPFLNNSK